MIQRQVAFLRPENQGAKRLSTVLIVCGCLLAYAFMPEVGPEDLFRYGAWTVGVTLLLAVLIESRDGMRQLIRADIIALCVLYFLTFAEFLDTKVVILYTVSSQGAVGAFAAVLLGMVGLALGRHIGSTKPSSLATRHLPHVSSKTIFTLIVVLFILGFFYVFLSVNFNLVDMFNNMFSIRFARPWQRGRIGDWSSFLTELSLLLYLVPVLAGSVFADSRQYNTMQKAIVIILISFMLFFDFTEGARNVVLIKACLLIASYMLLKRKLTSIRSIVYASACIIALWLVSGLMLNFRNVGLSSYFAANQALGQDEGGFMIDNNMYTIAGVVDFFPRQTPYLGSEVIYSSLIHPIPRALWPSKPEEWSTSIESVFGVTGATLAVTYIGEAYLIAGFWTVFAVSLFLGMCANAWNKVGYAARSNLDVIYYASGFYAASLGMRSMQWISVAVLPSIAIYFIGRYYLRRQSRPQPQFRPTSSLAIGERRTRTPISSPTPPDVKQPQQ